MPFFPSTSAFPTTAAYRTGIAFPAVATYKDPYDAAARSFFTRAGITNGTQINAVNQLVLDLKYYGIWSKINALYPLVGGTAASHAENLVSSSYQITWNGSVTHNSAGITSDGSTGYGNLNGAENVILGGNTNIHMSAYISTQPAADAAARVTISGGNAYMFRYRDSAPTNNMSFYIAGSSIAFATGFVAVSQIVSGSVLMQSGSTQSSASGSDVTLGATNMNILRNTTAIQYSNLTHSFISAGTALLSTDLNKLAGVVLVYETALGRQ